MEKQLKAYAILLDEKSVSLKSLVKGGYDMKFAFEFIKKLLALGFVKDSGNGNFLLCVPEQEVRKIMRAEKCEYKDFSDDELKRIADDIDLSAILVLAHISQSETGYSLIELCEAFKGDFTRHLEVLRGEGLISYDEGSYIGKISPENLLKLILMALDILSFELAMINKDRCDFDTPALKKKRIDEINNLTAQLLRKGELIRNAIATGELVADGDLEYDFGYEDDDDTYLYDDDDSDGEDEKGGEEDCFGYHKIADGLYEKDGKLYDEFFFPVDDYSEDNDDSETADSEADDGKNADDGEKDSGDGENEAESEDKVRADMISFLKQFNVDDAEALYDQMFEQFDGLDDIDDFDGLDEIDDEDIDVDDDFFDDIDDTDDTDDIDSDGDGDE